VIKDEKKSEKRRGIEIWWDESGDIWWKRVEADEWKQVKDGGMENRCNPSNAMQTVVIGGNFKGEEYEY